MVGLLALGASDRKAPATEPVPAVAVEPVDTYEVGPTSIDSADRTDQDGSGR